MADYSLFNTRVNAYGDTTRERIVNTAKEDIAKNLYDHPNLRDVRLGTNSNKTDRKIVVISTKDPNVKQLSSLPGEFFLAGQYVGFADEHWLIDKADVDDEMYVDGQMTLCPNTLKFQDSQGNILSYPYFVENPLPHLDSNKLITTSSSTRKIKLPFDEHTRSFYIDKRFMGEVFNGVPQCFKIIDLNAETEKGLLVVTQEKDEFNADTDNVELGICNYFEPYVKPNLNVAVEIQYSGKAEIRTGGSSKKFTAIFKDGEGNILSDVVADWEVIPMLAFIDNVSYEINENIISISADDVYGIIGTDIKLLIKNEGFETELIIIVKGLV